ASLPTNSGWVLNSANAINDSGEIVGSGSYNGQTHAFALIPTLPDVTNCIQNICFVVSNIHPTATGMVGAVTMRLPVGFSVGAGPGNRVTSNYVSYAEMLLDSNFNPQSNTLTLPALFYGVHESLPMWFGPGPLTWHVDTGEVTLANGGGAFVRQSEDDSLTINQDSLVEPETANR